MHLTFGAGSHSHRKPGFRWIGHGVKETVTKSEEENHVVSSEEPTENAEPRTPTKNEAKKESINSYCQTSPSLLRSLIHDINSEIEEAKKYVLTKFIIIEITNKKYPL